MQNQLKPINSSDGQFQDGNPYTGALGTVVTSEWLNGVQSAVQSTQRELLKLLQDSKQDPDSNRDDQLLQAVRNIAWGGNSKPATLAGYGIAIASQTEAEAGTDNDKAMTPLRVEQALNAAGLSGYAKNITSGSLQTVRPNGLYHVDATGQVSGAPDKSNGMLLANFLNDKWGSQVYWMWGGATYEQRLENGNWQPWIKLLKTGQQSTLADYGITDGASKTDLQKAVNDLVAGAPGALNTLQELAAALGNDQNFAATVTNKLANKADKSSSLAGYGINTLALSTAQTAQIIKTTPNIYDNNLYTSGTLELRSTGTDFPSLGLHRPGNSAVALVHKGYGNDTLMLKEASGGEYRVWHSGNDASFIKRRRYRISVDDKTSLDDAITACETGFNYGTSSGVTGPYIAFGGLGEANSNLNYPCQLTADYTTGYVMRFRTRNDDAQRWNPWYSLIHEGYLTGQVAFFAMANPPQGWLQARGNAVSRTVYAALFAAIGTTYGAGDGSTTFNLPDLRGEFVRGWDANVDQGRVFGSKQKGTLVVTNEYFNDGELYNISTNVGLGHAMDGTTAFGADVPNLAEYPGLELHSVTGNRATLDNYVSSIGVARPHNIALLACIKY